jgi:PAS domain S-box-containing protein
MGWSAADLPERLFDASPSPVIGVDLRGRIHLFSRSAEETLGYTADEARAHLHVTDLYHRPDDARRVMNALRGEGPAGRPTLELTLRARNGELVPVLLTATLVHDAAGAIVGTLGFFLDRREAISMGARLEEAADQVIASERRAANVSSAAAAAYELSQPLTAAMGHLEILLESELPPASRERAARAYAQLERIGRIAATLVRAGRAA